MATGRPATLLGLVGSRQTARMASIPACRCRHEFGVATGESLLRCCGSMWGVALRVWPSVCARHTCCLAGGGRAPAAAPPAGGLGPTRCWVSAVAGVERLRRPAMTRPPNANGGDWKYWRTSSRRVMAASPSDQPPPSALSDVLAVDDPGRPSCPGIKVGECCHTTGIWRFPRRGVGGDSAPRNERPTALLLAQRPHPARTYFSHLN